MDQHTEEAIYTPINYKFKSKSAPRQLFSRPVNSKFDPNPCLLLTNFPPFITKSNLKQVLSDNFGSIVKILLTASLEGEDDNFESLVELYKSENSPPNSVSGLFLKENYNPFKVEQLDSYGFAYVYFYAKKSLEKVYNFCKKEDKELKFNFENLKQKFSSTTVNICSESLNNECNLYLDWYDNQQTRQENLKKSQQQDQDDEGWTLVGDDNGAKYTEANQEFFMEKMEKKRKNDCIENFYSGQVKKARKTKSDLIREQFEKSRREILLRRKDRNFKPK